MTKIKIIVSYFLAKAINLNTICEQGKRVIQDGFCHNYNTLKYICFVPKYNILCFFIHKACSYLSQ